MATYFDGSDPLNQLENTQGFVTYDQFMAASPDDRYAYMASGAAPGRPDTLTRGMASKLRNVVPDQNSWVPLTAEQYRTILTSSNIDPSLLPAISGEFGNILTEQDYQRQVTGKDRFGMYAPALLGGVAALGNLAFGGAMAAESGAAAGAGAAEGSAAAGGLEAGASPFMSGLDAGAISGADLAGEGLASGGATAGGSLMPSAIPEVDPTFGGALTQTAPGAFETMPMTAGGAGAAVPIGAGTLAGTALQAAASGGASGGGASGGSSGSNGTPLSRILDGTASTADYLSAFGSIAPAALGVYGSSQMADAYKDLNNQYMALGAPSRARYEASFQPGFSMSSEPGYQDALNQTTDAFLRKMSTQGNPFGNPGAWAETLKGVNTSLALPALYNYRNQNAATGGFGAFNTAAPGAANASIGSTGNIYNSIGAGAADLFNPPKNTMADFAKLFRGGLA